MNKRQADLQRRAIDEPRLTLDDIAQATGLAESSLKRYRLATENRLRLPEENAKRLAAFLRQHADKLKEIAAKLERIED